MTFMPTTKDIQEGLEHEDIVIMERAWQLLLTLAEADSAVMRMFDVLEVSLRDGVFGPDYIPVVSWAVHSLCQFLLERLMTGLGAGRIRFIFPDGREKRVISIIYSKVVRQV